MPYLYEKNAFVRLVAAEKVRELDRATIEDYGLPGIVLMENAGRGAAQKIARDLLEKYKKKGRVSILVGPGNNGGDGFVIARYLSNWGWEVDTFTCTPLEKMKGDADFFGKLATKNSDRVFPLENQKQFEQYSHRIQSSDAIVDSLFGTGLQRNLKGYFLELIQAINSFSSPLKFAIDIPSGLHSDLGLPMPIAFKADLTITFALCKIGLYAPHAREFVGRLELQDIGIPLELIEKVEVDARVICENTLRERWPKRTFNSHKGSFGHLMVVAGSVGKSGAALMAAKAALRTGVGLCTLYSESEVLERIDSQVHELMYEPLIPFSEQSSSTFDLGSYLLEQSQGYSALAIGPGIAHSVQNEEVVVSLVKNYEKPLLLDATALRLLAKHGNSLKSRKGTILLTPHPGEMSALCGLSTKKIQEDRVGIARSFAKEHGCVLVLKGAVTVIANPLGECWLNPTGHSGLSTAGTGDVLAGMISAFLAQGCSAVSSALLGVYFHGKVADELLPTHGMASLNAFDLIENLPKTFAAWERSMVM